MTRCLTISLSWSEGSPEPEADDMTIYYHVRSTVPTLTVGFHSHSEFTLWQCHGCFFEATTWSFSSCLASRRLIGPWTIGWCGSWTVAALHDKPTTVIFVALYWDCNSLTPHGCHWDLDVGLVRQEHSHSAAVDPTLSQWGLSTLTVLWHSHSAMALSQCCRPRPNCRRRRRSVPEILHPERSWIHHGFHVGSVDFMYACMHAWISLPKLWFNVRPDPPVSVNEWCSHSARGAGLQGRWVYMPY